MQLWDIESNTDLSVKGRFQRDSDGNEVWVVVAKKTWQWLEGAWHPLAESEIFDDPQYLGEPGLSAMKVDHEFVYLKNNTDVLLYGKARSYAKKPVTQHECRLLIDGHIDKALSIIGERNWIEHGGSVTVSRPVAFIEAEIDYSCAIGGDERNRIGGGVAKSNQELLEQKVPSVFYSQENWQSSTNKIRVAGFGPLPPFFKSRSVLAGTFDDHWVMSRKPMLPEDFDLRFYQSAPLDQQCKGHLVGGERIVISGFCHNETLSFRIPATQYSATANFDGEIQRRAMDIYTVFIDAEAKTLSLSFNASFPCQGREHLLTTTQVVESHEEVTNG